MHRSRQVLTQVITILLRRDTECQIRPVPTKLDLCSNSSRLLERTKFAPVSDILAKIVAHKRTEIAAAKAEVSREDLESRLATAPPPRDFAGAIRAADGVALIAEVKKASPSAGLIREDFDPEKIAKDYTAAGATCLSVLTDEHFFKGNLDFLSRVRSVVEIPVLRKDFILDPYQVVEARAAGADCVLLIAECLEDDELAELYSAIRELGMTALVELYDPANLPRVLNLSPSLVGINNRNLKTFHTDIAHTLRMRDQIPAEVLLVGESGIRTHEDVETLANANVDAMLVGESLMRQKNIQQAVRALLGRSA